MSTSSYKYECNLSTYWRLQWNEQPQASQNRTEAKIPYRMSPALNFLKMNIVPPVIFCQAAAVHHAAGHVLAVARITLHHHGGRLEDRHGDLCHGQLLMVCLLCRDDWCIGGQHEVDAWVWHQVGLEPWLQSIQSSNHPIQTQNMSQNPIQTQNMSQKIPNKSTKSRGDKATKLYDKTPCALGQETQWCPRSMHHQIAMKQSLTAGRREKRWKDVCKLLKASKKTPKITCCWNEVQWGDDLGNQPVQVGVSWTLDVQVPAANIVEGLVVLKKWEQEAGGRSPPLQPEIEQRPQQGEQQHI